MTSGTTRFSGVVLKEAESLVLTASLPLGLAPLVTIETGDGKKYNGWIVGRNDQQNLALVRVVGATLPGLVMGDAFALPVGEELLQLGYALLLEGKLYVQKGKVANVAQDLASGMRFVQVDVPYRPGIAGGALVNRKGELVAMNVESTFVQSIGVSPGSGANALGTDFIQLALTALKRGGAEVARPTPTANPGLPPPSFVIFDGTVTVGGKPAVAGTRLYARLVNSSLGDVWVPPKGEVIREGGAYTLTAAASPQYSGVPVEFYINGVKANEATTFSKPPGEIVVPLNLTFPQ